MNYYFTFGTDEQFPYQNGCVKVIAGDREEAIARFNKRYPPRKESGLVNCAFIYDQNEFGKAAKRVDRYSTKRESYLFTKCWDVINEKD